MSANGMNYSMYNTLAYPQMTQQPALYAQRFSNPVPQQSMPQYDGYQMYPPSMATQPQYNSYDHVVRSAAESLAGITCPSNVIVRNNQQARFSSSHQSQNRRPANNNLSGVGTVPTRMYYCETCRIACGGHATYQAHLNGAKHKKKEQIAQNQQPSVHMSSKPGVNMLRCELCDITCTSSEAYKAHLDGSKHEKAMKLHRKLGKTIPSADPQILNNTQQSSTVPASSQSPLTPSAAQSPSISVQSTEPKPATTNQQPSAQSSTLSRLLENSIKPIGEEYVETLFDGANKPLLYHCKLCECKFNDTNAKDMHLKGKRHRLSYKKKVDPNFVIDDNGNQKLPSPKQQRSSMSNHQISNGNPSNSNNNQSEIDNDTRFLMTLHQQIVPTPELLNTVEQFISAVETALKSCSNRLRSSTSDNESTANDQSPLMGVARIGLLAKSLMVKSDRTFHLVIVCTEWPTINLFQSIALMLYDNFQEIWKNKLHVECQMEEEILRVQANTDEGTLNACIAFTSPSIQQQEKSNETQAATDASNLLLLSKNRCLEALYAMHSARWFQNQVSTRQHASALIRCLRYKTTISNGWQSLPSEAIEILVEYMLSQLIPAADAFRRLLECLSGGLALQNGPGLRVPWQTNPTRDVFVDLTEQQRNDITQEAQMGLRLMAFGRLNQWLEQPNLSSEKRTHDDMSDASQISTKRQCVEVQGESNVNGDTQ